MTTYELNNSSNLKLYEYSGKLIMAGDKSLHHQIEDSSATLNATCNSSFKIEREFSKQDKVRLHELYLDFTLKNINTSDTMTIFNIFLLFQQITLRIDNIELCKYDDPEKIFLLVSENLKDYLYSTEQTKAALNLFTDNSNGFNGVVIPPASQAYISIPIFEFLTPSLKYIQANELNKIELEFKTQTNTNNAILNTRFIMNSTGNNIYNNSDFQLTDIHYRLSQEKFSKDALIKIPTSPVLLFDDFEIKPYTQSWTLGTENLRINLKNDFSTHNKIQGLYFYVYPKSNNVFNAGNAGKVFSDFGFKVLYKSNVILDFSNYLQHRIRRRAYFTKCFRKRHGALPTDDYFKMTNGNLTQSYYSPLLYIDFNEIRIENPRAQDIVNLLDNTQSEYEIIIYNNGTNYGDLLITAALHFNTIYSITGGSIKEVK